MHAAIAPLRRLRVAPLRGWAVVCLEVSAALFSARASAQQAPATYVCAADLNGDGYIDAPGEEQGCTYDAATASTPSGYACPLQAQACTESAASGWTCPLGANYQCLGANGQTPSCSSHACVNLSNTGATVAPPVSGPAPTSNGPTDANNNCLGVVHIFPGQASSCKGQGVEDFWTDCCASSVTQTDTMGAFGQESQQQQNTNAQAQASLAAQLAGYKCSSEDTSTAEQRASGYCVHVGDYCQESWPLVGCVQEAHSYCCFNSELARIIQEQGRAQIPSMGGFGTPSAPNCSGFTPAQFQSIDWSKINFSEYYSELQYSSPTTIQSQVNTSAVPQ